MTDSLARARADLEAGRAWKARDRLNGLLTHRQDFEVLDLLATVHHEMNDLPAAGALWFVTGRDDEIAQRATAAWRERFGHDEGRWRSIPAAIRREVDAPDLESLREAALVADRTRSRHRSGDGAEFDEAWWEPIVFGGGLVLFLLWLVTMIGIGMWTVGRWIWT